MNPRKEQFIQLIKELELPPTRLVLVGDGSGTTAANPSGWHVMVYDRQKETVAEHTGAATIGTNNYAELTPYTQALWAFQASLSKTEAIETESGYMFSSNIQVAIVSDSELTVKGGNRVYGRNANGSLWAALEWFETHGYRFFWKHVPRNSNPISAECDRKAGLARLTAVGFKGM